MAAFFGPMFRGTVIPAYVAHSRLIQDQGLGINGLRLLDLLFHYPVVNVTLVKDRLDIAFVTANKLVKQLETLGLVDEVTGGKKNRIFRYSPYLNLFDPPDTDPDDDSPLQSTKIGRSLLEDADAN